MNLTLPLFESLAPVDPAEAPDAPVAPVAPCPLDLPDPLAAALADRPAPSCPQGAQAAQGPADPGALHPALWRASQLGSGRQRATASGFEALDAQLPGQGWPHGELTELLLAQPGIGELRLLAPALAAIGGGVGGADAPAWAEGPRCVMLFEPPAALSAWALAQQGLSHQHWLVVQARAGQRAGAGPGQTGLQGARAARTPRTPSGLSPLLPSADLLWALEQALRSGQVGAVLAWLPAGLRADALRRLQLAAQAHDGPVFLFREAQALHRPSAAPLRLLLQPAGVDGLTLRLLKRRGPPLAEPLRLVLPSVLTPHQQARALAQQALQGAQQAAQLTAQQEARAGAVDGAGPGHGRRAGRGVRAPGRALWR
ncbi:hypothetical protein AACH10_17505 [Ideonella sp. DXS22W]|uniref:Translesion DNA synthesis-associated protein ImuA n=1 Tax=Pseudaquabacterium inlustre TaxID=2984192 RepID=A0ABU9CNB8_9BURK